MDSEQHGQLLTPEEVVDRIFLLVDENGDGNGGQRWGAAHSTAPPGPPSPSHCSPQLGAGGGEEDIT